MTKQTVRISAETSEFFSSTDDCFIHRGWVHVDLVDEETGAIDISPDTGFASGAHRTCMNDTTARGDAVDMARNFVRAYKLIGHPIEIVGFTYEEIE